MEGYKTVKGWSGKKYYVKMTEAEIESRRKLGLFISVMVTVPAMVFLFALCAGMLK